MAFVRGISLSLCWPSSCCNSVLPRARLASKGSTCDLVSKIATPHPLLLHLNWERVGVFLFIHLNRLSQQTRMFSADLGVAALPQCRLSVAAQILSFPSQLQAFTTSVCLKLKILDRQHRWMSCSIVYSQSHSLRLVHMNAPFLQKCYKRNTKRKEKLCTCIV